MIYCSLEKTQKFIADRIYLIGMYSHFNFNGEINITAKTVGKILNGLNVSVSEFFRDADIILEDSDMELLFKEISSSDKKDEITQVLKGIVDLSK